MDFYAGSKRWIRRSCGVQAGLLLAAEVTDTFAYDQGMLFLAYGQRLEANSYLCSADYQWWRLQHEPQRRSVTQLWAARGVNRVSSSSSTFGEVMNRQTQRGTEARRTVSVWQHRRPERNPANQTHAKAGYDENNPFFTVDYSERLAEEDLMIQLEGEDVFTVRTAQGTQSERSRSSTSVCIGLKLGCGCP